MWVLTRATGRRPRWIHKREFYVWISLSHLKILFHHLQARKNMSTAEKTSTFMSKVGDFCKIDLRHHGWLSPRTLLMLDHFWKQGFRKCYFFFKIFFFFFTLEDNCFTVVVLCSVGSPVWQSESYIFPLSLPLTSHPTTKFHLILVRMTSSKKSTNKSWWGCGEMKPSFTDW